MRKRFLTFAIMALFLLVFSFPATGRSQELNDYSSDFIIEIVPNNPRPGETVSAKVVSYQFDINRSVITWTLDGKAINQGLGKKTAEFTLPSIGKESSLVVSIVTDSGIETSKTKKFSGSDIDFLWEARTTVPAAYKGKALPTHKSVVQVTALPHLFVGGKAIPRSGLVYQWSLNHKLFNDYSGQEKKKFSFKINDFGLYVVTLKIMTQDKKIAIERSVNFSIEDNEPKIFFYEDKPLEGAFYGKAISGVFQLKEKDLNVRAEPYFFNLGNGIVSYNWFMNDKFIKPSKRKNIVVLRSGEGAGSSELSLEIEKEGDGYIQTAEEIVQIKF